MLLPLIAQGLSSAHDILQRVKSNPSLLDERDERHRGPIFVAAVENRLEILNALLALEASQREVNEWRICSPTHPAALLGYLEVIKSLMEHSEPSLNPSASPLLPAAHAGRLEIIEYLLSLGLGLPNASERQDTFPEWAEWLERAVIGNKPDVLELAFTHLLPHASEINEHWPRLYETLVQDSMLKHASECFAWLVKPQNLTSELAKNFSPASLAFGFLTRNLQFLEEPVIATLTETLRLHQKEVEALVEEERNRVSMPPDTRGLPHQSLIRAYIGRRFFQDSDITLSLQDYENLRPSILPCVRIICSPHLDYEKYAVVLSLLAVLAKCGFEVSIPFSVTQNPSSDPLPMFYDVDGSVASPFLIAVCLGELEMLQAIVDAPQFDSDAEFTFFTSQESMQDVIFIGPRRCVTWLTERLDRLGMLESIIDPRFILRALSRNIPHLAEAWLRRMPQLLSEFGIGDTPCLFARAVRYCPHFAKSLILDSIAGFSLAEHYTKGDFGLCVDSAEFELVKIMVARKNEFGNHRPFSEESMIYEGYRSLLTIPSSRGSAEIVRLLVEEAGVGVEEIDLDIETHPFFPAFCSGHVEVLEFYESLGPNILDLELENSNGTLLHRLAALVNADETALCRSLKFLLSRVSVDFASFAILENGMTPLICMATQGRSQMVKLMLEARVHWQWQPGMIEPPFPAEMQASQASIWPKSSISSAIQQGHVSVLKEFFNFAGANAFVTAHIQDCIASSSLECFDFLVDTVFPWFLPTNPSGSGNMKLYQRKAASRAQSLFEMALPFGAWSSIEHLAGDHNLVAYLPPEYFPEMRCPWNGTPAQWTRLHELGVVGTYMNYSVAEMRMVFTPTLSRGYPFNQVDICDNLLWDACTKGDLGLVKAMYRAGADLNRFETTPHPRSALLCASLSDQLLTSRWLLSKGCTLEDFMPRAQDYIAQSSDAIKYLFEPLLGHL